MTSLWRGFRKINQRDSTHCCPSPALVRRPALMAQNLIKSILVSVTLRDTSGAVVMCTATNCSM